MTARRFPPDVHSGTETVFEALYQQARPHHDVRLLVGYQRERRFVPPEAVGVDLRGMPQPKRWLRMARAIHQEARRFRPDVVLSNSIEIPPLSIPTACIVHDLNFGKARGGRLRRLFYTNRCRGLDAVITVSHASAQALHEIDVSPDKIRVINNGVDFERFVPQSTDGELFHFVFPSRILPGKGQHHAIDALARLPQAHKNRCRLTIVGAVVDPTYVGQLRVQAKDQPVDFVLDVPDMLPWYQRADVVLFPSLMAEGFGFTAVEAMSCGKPVIWYEQPAVREATGGVGIALPAEVPALRDAMVALMDDPERRQQLGEQGRALVEKTRAWPRVWARYERVLSDLAGR